MRIVCGWCKEEITTKETWLKSPSGMVQVQDDRVSHGMCPECFEKNMAILERVRPTLGGVDHSTITDADIGGEA